MNFKFLIIIVLTVFIFSCGKKDEQVQQQDTTKQQQTVEQQQTQQNTQQQQTEQQKQTKDTTSATDKKKEEEITKKDEEKKDEKVKKEEEKKDAEKKKDEEKKKIEDDKKKIEDNTASDIDFSQIFPKKCAKCHGKDLKGKVEGVPDLTAAKTQNKSEDELVKIITNGKKGKTEDDEDMPSWKNKLTEDEIRAAAKFVLSH